MLAAAVVVGVAYLNFVVGFIIPLLTGFLTKAKAPSWFKAVMNLGLSAVAGAVTTAIAAEGKVEVKTWVTGIMVTWAMSWASYTGWWKPSGVAEAVQQTGLQVGPEVPVVEDPPSDVPDEAPPRATPRPRKRTRKTT